MDNQDMNNKFNEDLDNQDIDNDIEDLNMDNDDNIDDEQVDSSIEEDMDQSDDRDVFTYTVDNNNINNDYNGFKNDDNKSYIYIFIGLSILIGIIILIIVFVNKGESKKSGYVGVENELVDAAKSYYEKNTSLLPSSDGMTVTVDSDTLIQNSYLKPFSEMVSGDVYCTGSVIVYNNNSEYLYFPNLDCGDAYKSVALSQKIIGNSLVTTGDGLYKVNNEYVFRGEYPNNYVSFDDKLWRIVKINSNNTIKMILIEEKVEKNAWDDRYNSSNNNYSGINDFRVSRVLEYLNNMYDTNEYVSKKNTSLLVKNDWCIGKLSEEDMPIDSLNLCSDVYGDLYIGLLQADEVLKASVDQNCVNIYDGECTNYNYFTTIPTTWTLNASADKSFNVFYSTYGSISYRKASSSNYVRPVININSNVLYISGDGTEDNPYVLGN